MRLAERSLVPDDPENTDSKLISERINTAPAPFVFRLSDGTRVPVVHLDYVAVSPGQILVIGEDEAVTKFDPLRVVAIEEEAPRKSSNSKLAQ